ncbi:hypothetical protein D3C81_1132910 [compost metagenome]
MIIMKYWLCLTLFVASTISYLHAQEKVNVILLGTYHFNNPGNDAMKVAERNILSEKDQLVLEEITETILRKNIPDQIFVESAFSQKKHLNYLYQLYLDNQYSRYTDTLQSKRSKRYYIEGETFQLAFRLAKKSNHQEVFPIDTMIEMRFDLLFKELNANPDLKKEFDTKLATSSKIGNETLTKEKLRDVFLALNEDHALARNKGIYLSLINKVGIQNDYLGTKLVSDWFKRNLIMYSNFQSQLKSTTKTVVILVGTGHAAILRDFIKNDDRFNLIDLKNIL